MLLPHVSDSSLSRASPPHSSLRLLSHSPRHRTTPLHLTRPFTLGHCGGPSKADRPCVCAGGCGCDVSQFTIASDRVEAERRARRPPSAATPFSTSSLHRAPCSRHVLSSPRSRTSRVASRLSRPSRAQGREWLSLLAVGAERDRRVAGGRATLVRKIRHARKRQTGPTTACVTYLVCLGPDRIYGVG